MLRRLSLTSLVAIASPAVADAPTAGTPLSTAPLAGEFDGRVVATNPGGLPLVRGAETALVFDYQRDEASESAGDNTGLYVATAFGGGGVLPRLGLGFGVDWLHAAAPAAGALDLGDRVRYTLSSGTGLGGSGGWGVAWHHFSDDGALHGVDTFDLGLSARAGNRVAFGVVVRDLNRPTVAGVRGQRTYALETVVRPTARAGFELALGGRIGETDHDVDGWLRTSLRLARGVVVHAAVESRETERAMTTEHDLRATAGLELSFGATGAIVLASGQRASGETEALGGQVILRASQVGPASVLGRRAHVERVELTGELDLEQTTALVRRLRTIARDRSARGVIVVLDRLAAGSATREELRDELVAVRRAGKVVVAHMLSGTQAEYFVASAADKVYVDPAVDLDLVGISITQPYLRGTLDKLGVVPQFVKIAEFKDAPETFTEKGPSAASARQMGELVDSIWGGFLGEVAASRKLSKDELAKIVDGGPYTPDDLAKDGRLVDGVATTAELAKLVATAVGRELPVDKPAARRPERWRPPAIAVIYVGGEIVRGKSSTPSPIPLLGGGDDSGDETIVAAIKKAREDTRVGAIVLRINSPGGDAVASELIAREVFATRGKKPIVCSFADYAASGGYFIAAGCEAIFAEPMTITGSIGVFGGKLDISGLAGTLGVSSNTVQRGARAGISDLFGLPLVPLPVSFRSWSEDERAKLMDSVRYAYGRFVGAVASGRGMTRDAVDAVARGRVWSGAQARAVKLVDHGGGLNAAIDEATRRIGIADTEDLELVELPEQPGLFESLRRAKQARTATLPARSPLLARLPFELVW